jgi:serine/threonine protein kinase
MQNTMAFPPTPTHSFDSLYQPSFSNTLGKRPLQLDAQDFPHPKRHESIGDFDLFSQLTPAASVEFGLSDEAADMCAMWFNKYAILPSDRHIDSLSQLTGESAEAIRHWFGRLMKQGMTTTGDSAYRSQTALLPSEPFWNEHSTGLMQVPQLPLEEVSTQESIVSPETSSAQDTATVNQVANTLRGGKKSRCTPTDDLSLLSRDSSKIYQCTRKCGKRYGRKCDWKRNEEEGYPCKSWVCSLCTTAGVENVKPCFRKYHFAQHFRNIHPGISCDTYEEASVVCSETEFPRRCGFCKHRFASRQERIDHIADHFKQGKCMLDWNDGDDSDNSDNSDDDNDDRPSDSDSDSSTSPPRPPQRDPRGGSNSKYNGGGGFTDGNNGDEGSQGGYFQFQLSQLSEGETGSSAYYAQQHIKQTSDLRIIDKRTRCASEPPQQRRFEENRSSQSSSLQGNLRGKLSAPEGDHTDALARNAIAGSLALTECVESVPYEVGQKSLHNQGSSDNSRRSRPGADPDWLDVLLKSRPRPMVGKTARSIQSTNNRNSDANRTDIASAIDPALAGQQGLQSPNRLPMDSKVESYSKDGHLDRTLTAKQALQTIQANSQSFLSVRFLGSGGFSTVDEVVHRDTKLRLGRKTLKNRDPAAVKELWKEVDILQKLRHPHVIRFLGAYSQGDKMSILLSPIADTTLSLWLDRFSQKKPANFGNIINKMFGCLASSVRYLHEQRPVVRHLDIKPQNILIVEGDGEFPHVVLCDFGISTNDSVYEGGTQPLTRQYVAPEVFGGSKRTSAADIWSLGCVFAEMASMPYSQDNGQWLSFRKEFSGRTGKYYWQDVPGLQDRLTELAEDATTTTEKTVVRTLQAMLRRQPAERPEASALTLIFTPAPCCLSWPNDKAAYPGPREEFSSVEMLIQDDGGECRTKPHQCSDLAGQGLPSAQTWLQQCSHSHEACSHANSGDAKTLPTRLLDIGSAGNESCIRLVDSSSIGSRPDSVDYVALSHMWTESHATLTANSLDVMKVGIPLSTLSDTLNTAITAAQGLGYRYIWTDSLCVVQDNEDSRQEECINMASVFRNAALTLILDSIDNSLDDFRNALAESTLGFAWDTRAWALQERLLSHRFLHLGQEQMYWECNSLKASQTFPQGLPLLVWEKAHSKPEMLKATQQPGMKENPAYNGRANAHSNIATNNKHGPVLLDRVRDNQWIRKEGDSKGDSMEAAQKTLHFVGAQAPPPNAMLPPTVQAISAGKQTFPNDKLGNFPVFTTSTCADGKAPLSSDGGTKHTDDLVSANGRRDIKSSGQMDRHGSKNGRLRDGNANENGIGVSGTNGNGTKTNGNGNGARTNGNGNGNGLGMSGDASSGTMD